MARHNHSCCVLASSSAARTVAVVALLGLYLMSSLVREAGAGELYSYQGHQKLTRGDEETDILRLNTPIVFLRQSYGTVVVSL